MGDRHGGDQRLGVGVQRVGVERPLVRDLHDVAQIVGAAVRASDRLRGVARSSRSRWSGRCA
jgi:hypothetical protein